MLWRSSIQLIYYKDVWIIVDQIFTRQPVVLLLKQSTSDCIVSFEVDIYPISLRAKVHMLNSWPEVLMTRKKNILSAFIHQLYYLRISNQLAWYRKRNVKKILYMVIWITKNVEHKFCLYFKINLISCVCQI